MTKKDVRDAVKQKREQLSEASYAQSSSEITDRLIKNLEFDDYDEFFFYYPLPGEISLIPFAAQVLSIGKRVYFPRVDGAEMEFFRIHDLNADFTEGAFHVMEPVGGEKPSFAHAICFLPGLAFDGNLNRLGHGAGYYDKYLAAHPDLKKVAICGNRFFLPEVPVDEHDVPMDAVVTETTIYGKL